MKSGLGGLMTAIAFIASSNAFACPDLSGSYFAEDDSATTELTLVQTGCEQLVFENKYTSKEDGSIVVETQTMIADGIFRDVHVNYPAVERFYFTDTALVDEEIAYEDAFNSRSPLSSMKGTLALDADGNLVFSGANYDKNGNETDRYSNVIARKR